ncbi:MAG: tetratricopeptide repeat protein [Gemmatimonadaceae bacterium]|nr:tetratricopeptide repeat protein [Gloeobacterales cyanobacterium ES-bin-141]
MNIIDRYGSNSLRGVVAVLLGAACILGGPDLATNAQPLQAEQSITRTASRGGLSSEDLLRQGVDQAQKGDYETAINRYTQALRVDPKLVSAYNGRGLARFDLGDERGAIEDYTQALRIDPELVRAYVNRGLARSALGDRQGALKDLNTALRIDPRNANAYDSRGDIRAQMGNKQAAIQDYRKAANIYSRRGDIARYEQQLDNIGRVE